MGFSTLLLGKPSRDALLLLQDAELRLLENMKRCLCLRVKCDREYAIALNTMCMQAQRTDATNELRGSLVAKGWKILIEETEAFSRLIKQNADHLGCITIEKINFLISEKRMCRKIYLEEHNRIESELLLLQDKVLKMKNDYEKCLENFKLIKAKYEEQRGKSSKKIEETREKYQKACRKLHRIHNEYVLLLCEAAEYEKSFRSVLLPSLLEFEQSLQEEMVEHWRIILSEFVQYTDLTSNNFQELQAVISKSVQEIKPSSEYKDFMEKHKSPPPLPVAFIFDRKLIEDYNSKLKPNAVTADDLTFTLLKMKLVDLDDKIKECQALVKEKHHQIIQCENEIAALRKTSEMAATLFVKKKMAELLRYEINSLKSKQQKYQKQKDLIVEPLSQIGEDGPPLALMLPEEAMDQRTESSISLAKLQSHNLVDMFRRPFLKRQSVADSQSMILEEDCEQNTMEEDKPDSVNILCINPDAPLEDEDWFHGVLPREEVIRLLVKEGDYLVRETTRNEERQIVLSVHWHGHKHFIIQNTVDKKFRFEGPTFPTIQELLFYQHNSGLPVTNKSGAILKNPIFRERWELCNSDVELVTKIGRGNFGDVYRARLISSQEEVAVKTCHMTLPDEQKKKFLQEGRILKQYDHPNIVKLIGICVQKQPIMIVMELVPGGSLLNFLRINGHTLSEDEKVKMCLDCAAGMEYLESKNCIHRDLAARNCLIGKNNIVKISDFGMSREEEEYIVSDGMKQIPIKWTAPEALNFGKYTSLCDVWSFGVLMWEIFSNGSTPYSGLSNNRAREMIDSGYRMPAPDGTPPAVYQLMLKCWEYDPDNRPHFNVFFNALQTLFPAVSEKRLLSQQNEQIIS